MADRVEGRNPVSELLSSGRNVERIVMLEGAKRSEPLEAIRRTAEVAGIPVEEAPRHRLDRMSERGAHQGVIAFVEPFRYASLDSVLAASQGNERCLLLALDHVTDPGNLGAIVRTADVAGASGVLIPKDRAASMTPSALKAAAGAAEHVPVCRETNLVRSLERCKEAGFWVVGASASARERLWDAPLEGRIVFALGSEGEGLARITERACDLLVSLPVAGHVGSLNVSAATAVLAYEWVRRSCAASS